MKKQLAFVIPSLDAGGGEKSLVNLLSIMNYDAYDVDLILLRKAGIFLKILPPQVNIVEVGGDFQIFTMGLLQSVKLSFQKRKWRLLINRLLFALKNKTIKNKAIAEQNAWRNVNSALPSFDKQYDVAIGFLEKSSIYFAVDKLMANIKIGWIHTNYSSSGMNRSFDEPYFKKLDYIIAVSAECKENLVLNFVSQKSKIKVIHNIISPELINELSEENIHDERFDVNLPAIVTVARLSHEKGIDTAIAACKILVDKGVSFKWYIIGDGKEKAALDNEIAAGKLQDHFILLGVKQNPYPFVKNATIYVQPSRYEGKSIAVDEAKILGKPIIVTDFTTAKDQINHLHNGLIAGTDAKSLALEIQNLLHNAELQSSLSLHLAQESLGTKDELQKLYKLIEN